ncbi:sialic acid-binding Ig-like lectin 14 [Pleuronectes platessa]|uniref:sialic acid-binding Ig-like lectin 14 n=1 Tax=Pleuronectes platessa TaxID=8262 RepID=UPI00232A604C|nr:sialic acid-binding Ig-like lectin 14 [Pleuronectes platessa]
MIFHSNTFSDQVQSEFKGRVSLLESDVSQKNCSIIINDLKESDSGTYQLRVKASPSEDSFNFLQRVTVSVKGLSQRPTVMIPPLTEGQPTTLTCTAPGLCSGSEPTFTWRWRGGGESDADLTGNITAFKTENVTEFAKRRSSTLSFSPSAKHHGTNITCTVLFQGHVSTEETATLSVSFAHTHITESAEKQELDGRSSVMLSCFSHSFPQVQHYSWYRKSQGEEKDELVSEHQNHTVYSNQSGVYYCIAQNEVDHSLSDPVHLFERNYLENLRFLVVALLLLMIISVIVVNLR